MLQFFYVLNFANNGLASQVSFSKEVVKMIENKVRALHGVQPAVEGNRTRKIKKETLEPVLI